ncbi:SMC5 protein, partial [Atractosteus spatula]|nr:SMC5 protein [Atractosteus spatula]
MLTRLERKIKPILNIWGSIHPLTAHKIFKTTVTLPRTRHPAKISLEQPRKPSRKNPRVKSVDQLTSHTVAWPSVHALTIRKRLNRKYFNGMRARKKTLLSKNSAHLILAKEHQDDPQDYWKNILWNVEKQETNLIRLKATFQQETLVPAIRHSCGSVIIQLKKNFHILDWPSPGINPKTLLKCYVGLYVKRGCSKGSIEIELYKCEGNLKINREIHVENNQSTWMINGKHASQKTVEEAVKALQIQVGNLCQFLPQEKVGEFAKMSKVELLEATEKSVGPPEMYRFHCELKNFRSKERELENICKEKAGLLEKMGHQNERYKRDVERYYEKQRHLDVINMLERKKPWVEYETVRRQILAVKSERDNVKSELKKLQDEQAPMLNKIKSFECQLKPLDNKMKEKNIQMKEAWQKCKNKQDQLDRKDKEIEDIQQALSLKQTEEADRQKRINNTRRMIDDWQAELNSIGSQDDVQPKIDSINGQLRQIQEEKAKIESERADVKREWESQKYESEKLQVELRKHEDLMIRKEEKLKERYRDTYNAMMWLRENRKLFRGNVYEPIMLVVNVRDAQHAKYIENQVSMNDLRAFVFQKQEDMEAFMSEVRDKQKLRVNAVIAPPQSCANKPPPRPIEALQRYGFFSYLRELFDAPEEVMSYLCNQYKVNEIPVGNEQTKAMIETVIKESQLKQIFTAEEKYTVKKSAYSNKTITSNTALRPSQFLTSAADADTRRQLEEQLQTAQQKLQELELQMRAFAEQQTQLDRRDNDLRNQKKELSELKGKKRQLEQKISTKLDSLKQMEQNGINLKEEEGKTKEKIKAVNTEKVTIVSDLIESMKRRVKLNMDRVHLALDSVQLTAEKTKLETDCREASARLRVLEDKYLELERKKHTLVRDCKGLMKKAQEICNLDPGQSDVPQDLVSVVHITHYVVHLICKTSVLDEYAKRTQEYDNLKVELDKKTKALQEYRESISQVKERWLNPLKLLVEQVNEKFSDFFRSMQCAGEVDLHSDNEEEYDKYGIRIRVKFRSSTQLHELTPHHQSGGERSVSTMLYLMSLQELNRCPFRVVDEINQARLLQNLTYADEMTVLCVHNGPYMLPPAKWNLKAFERRKQRVRRLLA